MRGDGRPALIPPARLPRGVGGFWEEDGLQTFDAGDAPEWFAAANADLAGLELRCIGIDRSPLPIMPSPPDLPCQALEGPAWFDLSVAVLTEVGAETPHHPLCIVTWSPLVTLVRPWFSGGIPDDRVRPRPSASVERALEPFLAWLAGLDRLTLWFGPGAKNSAHLLARLRAGGYAGGLPCGS